MFPMYSPFSVSANTPGAAEEHLNTSAVKCCNRILTESLYTHHELDQHHKSKLGTKGRQSTEPVKKG